MDPIASIITPSNNPELLARAADSVLSQTVPVEWIIVPNGPLANMVASTAFQIRNRANINMTDVRVMVHQKFDGCIGLYKHLAGKAAKGHIIIELDHDDMLAGPDVAGRVYEEYFHTDNSKCMVYSNTAYVEHPRFRNDVGWQYRDVEIAGTKMTELVAHLATARTLAEISYAPHHLRAWGRRAYQALGGHNPTMQILDDLDLMQRCYLDGWSFVHVDKPMYIYTTSPNQASVVRNAEIQREGVRLYHQRFQDLVKEEASRTSLPIYDLGGGHNSPHGWTSVDLYGDAEVNMDVMDMLVDAEDESIAALRAHDFLEHIRADMVVQFMNLAHRKLMPGGYLLTMTPSVSDREGRVGRGAFQDPTHDTFWSENNFWYYTNPNFAKYVRGLTAKFNAIYVETYYPSDWHLQNQIPYVKADLQKPPLANVVGPGYYR